MFSVFLLNKNTEMTPSPAEELQLMQAGLGKRNLSMNDDLTHSEVMHIDKYLLKNYASLSQQILDSNFICNDLL